MESSRKMPEDATLLDSQTIHGMKQSAQQLGDSLVYFNDDLFTTYTRADFLVSRIESKEQSEYKPNDFKIHISINRNLYDESLLNTNILNLLCKAIKNKTIDEFKLINLDSELRAKVNAEILDFEQSVETLEAVGTKGIFGANLKKSIDKNRPYIFNHSRTLDNPITIYLSPGFDSEKIAELCLEIDNALKAHFGSKSVPSLNTHSEADLQIQNHVYFRKQLINGKYAEIRNEKDQTVSQLKQEATQSSEYNNLKRDIQALTMEQLTAAPEPKKKV